MVTIFQNEAEYVDTKLGAEAEEISGTEGFDVTNSDGAVSDDAVVVAAATKQGRWSRDKIFAYFKDGEDNEQAFDLTKLPLNVVDHLSFLGFSIYVGRSNDRMATYNSLVSGNLSMRRVAGPKAVKVNDWRKAIANAFVEATKKSLAPMTIEEATAKAVSLSADQVRNLKTDTVVIKHYNKIKGTSGGLAALLG